MSNINLIAEARRNAPHSEDESLIMRLAIALEAKPATLGYVVVGRDGEILVKQFKNHDEAQAMADEWTKDCRESDIDWEYRVAEIVEATR